MKEIFSLLTCDTTYQGNIFDTSQWHDGWLVEANAADADNAATADDVG